jgi:O-antigen/teichoic acid export membrane protein
VRRRLTAPAAPHSPEHDPETVLPQGTARVSIGLAVLGVSAYAFLVITGRALGPELFGAVSTLYVLVYALGPGLFIPLEQEVGRLVATRAATGVGGARPVALRAGLLGTAVLLPLLLVAAVAMRPLADRLFDGSTLLVLSLGLALTGLLASHVSRGVFAGTQAFDPYSAQLGVEGAFRLVVCGALAFAGIELVGAYGLLVGLAPLVAFAVTAPALRGRLAPGPSVGWSELSGAVGLLGVASLLSQVLVNAGPVAVQVLADDGEREAAGQFLAAFVLARVPLFVFASVQATLLPGLARALAVGDRVRFGAQLRRVLTAVSALATAGVVGAAVLGPWAVELLFGPAFRLGHRDLLLLALSTAAFMLAVVLQPALVALGRYGSAALGWVVGAVVFVLACVPPDEVLLRVERALLLATGAALLTMALLLLRALRAVPGRPA